MSRVVSVPKMLLRRLDDNFTGLKNLNEDTSAISQAARSHCKSLAIMLGFAEVLDMGRAAVHDRFDPA
jgi:hypothetical protein